MINVQELKDRLKKRIDALPEEKLKTVSRFLESVEGGLSKAKLLSFAGSWTDLDEDTFKELTTNLEARRKNNRAKFF
jgi:hypothetical protein